jgi:hypothetical protein
MTYETAKSSAIASGKAQRGEGELTMTYLVTLIALEGIYQRYGLPHGLSRAEIWACDGYRFADGWIDAAPWLYAPAECRDCGADTHNFASGNIPVCPACAVLTCDQCGLDSADVRIMAADMNINPETAICCE